MILQYKWTLHNIEYSQRSTSPTVANQKRTSVTSYERLWSNRVWPKASAVEGDKRSEKGAETADPKSEMPYNTVVGKYCIMLGERTQTGCLLFNEGWRTMVKYWNCPVLASAVVHPLQWVNLPPWTQSWVCKAQIPSGWPYLFQRETGNLQVDILMIEICVSRDCIMRGRNG